MSRRPRRSELPLLFTGLPMPVEEWLRLAGIPVSPFRKGASVAPWVRRQSGQLVLFDSRNASSRFDSQTARDYGLNTINVAVLLAGGTTGSFEVNSAVRRASPRGRCRARMTFFDRLKKTIDGFGGIWMRLADSPFPYQCAAFRSSAPPVAADGRKAAADGRTGETDSGVQAWVRRRYVSGLPFFIPEAVSGPDGQPLGREILGRNEFPLLWQTTVEEFTRWWEVREKLELRVRRQDGLYRIECDTDFEGFQPMLELWRGSHVASFPLDSRGMVLAEDGMVFRQEHMRHPAGLAARPMDGSGEGSSPPRHGINLKSFQNFTFVDYERNSR